MKVVNVKNVAIGEGMTKICVPLVAPTDYDVDYQLRIIAKSEPDMVEFRADMYEKCFDREALMKTLAKIHDKLGQFPIIFTFRTKGEGGCMEAPLSQYHDLLIDAIDSGYIDIVDIEYFSDMEIVDEVIAEAHSKGVYVIVSNHDFKTTIPMEQIVDRFKSIIFTGADKNHRRDVWQYGLICNSGHTFRPWTDICGCTQEPAHHDTSHYSW